MQRFNKQMIVVFMFVAVAAISFASCGNKTAQAEAVDSDSVVAVDSVDTVAVDSAAADTAAVAE